jgi:predicted nucleic acid-binding protein
MRRAYVDASCLVAITLGARAAQALARRLGRFEQLFASNLLEAELRAAAARERVELDSDLLTWLDWVFPDRPLTGELSRVLAAGYLRGADAWHVACALYLVDDPADLPFLTLDQRQRTVARRLGFRMS